MHYNDIRHGTTVADELLPKYVAAWEKKGMVGSGSLYPDAWLEQQDVTMAAKDPAFTAWANAWMHAWRSDFVVPLYEKQSLGYITNFDGEIQLNPHELGNIFREMVGTEGAAADNKDTYREAIRRTKDLPKKAKMVPYTKPTFGVIAQWLSELGRSELDGLLKYADEHLQPTWEKGGLYYERNDEPYDEG